MKSLSYLVLIISITLVGNAFGQDVAVVYDVAIENGGGLGIVNAPQLADLIVEKLKDENITAEIVDSDGIVAYMDANPKGIFVLTQGNTPGTIFQNKGKDDLIHSWLRDGGIVGFIGDYPFYYYWEKGGRITAAGAGQQSVFGVTITNASVVQLTPTDLGKEYIPSLEKWTTSRPATLATLTQNDFEFESYAEDGTNADPIAYRSPDMKGWFINFHTSCCGTAIPANEQVSTEFAELISNRFAVGLPVEPTGKVSMVWGQLKSLR